jgi:tRNA dimethylallyltransferase
MIDGLSPSPKITEDTKQKVQEKLLNLKDTYEQLFSKDESYMKKIASNDRYRIEKALEIFIETNLIPSEYFQKNRPEPIIDDINIFQIQTEVDLLRKRISLRTKKNDK